MERQWRRINPNSNLANIIQSCKYLKSLTESQEAMGGFNDIQIDFKSWNGKIIGTEQRVDGEESGWRVTKIASVVECQGRESVILTRIDPLNAGHDAVNIGGGLYRVKKPIDMKEQSVDVSSEDNKLGSLRSINVKLAEQLRQKSQEIETLERQNVSSKKMQEKSRLISSLKSNTWKKKLKNTKATLNV